jgi:hypothetical protein
MEASMRFWFKAALLVAAAALVPACTANKKLAAPVITAVLPTTVSGVIPNIMVQFDRPMDPATAGSAGFYAILEDPSTTTLGFSVDSSALATLNEVRLIPTSPSLLNSGKTYHVYVAGAVTSAEGTPMGNTIHFDFATSAQTNATATSIIGWAGATPSAGAAGEIVLTWPDATGTTVGNGTAGPIIANYDIYMSTTSQGEDLMLPPSISPSPTSSPKTITGLTTGTTYYFKIQPRDSTGCVFTGLSEIQFVAP